MLYCFQKSVKRTIKVETYQNLQELTLDLNKFLLFYLFTRRHGSLRKELGAKVRTPFDAIQSWFNIKPELFKISPDEFRAYAMAKQENIIPIIGVHIVKIQMKISMKLEKEIDKQLRDKILLSEQDLHEKLSAFLNL